MNAADLKRAQALALICTGGREAENDDGTLLSRAVLHLTRELAEARESITALTSTVADGSVERDALARERDGARDAADRLRHGADIEGDHVCPGDLRADAAEARVRELETWVKRARAVGHDLELAEAAWAYASAIDDPKADAGAHENAVAWAALRAFGLDGTGKSPPPRLDARALLRELGAALPGLRVNLTITPTGAADLVIGLVEPRDRGAPRFWSAALEFADYAKGPAAIAAEVAAGWAAYKAAGYRDAPPAGGG